MGKLGFIIGFQGNDDVSNFTTTSLNGKQPFVNKLSVVCLKPTRIFIFQGHKSEPQSDNLFNDHVP